MNAPRTAPNAGNTPLELRANISTNELLTIVRELDALRAENQRLREALQRLQDICVSPTYRQACFADATEQARAALQHKGEA